MPLNGISFEPVAFDAVPGWREDDHLAAWKAFLASCTAVLRAPSSAPQPGKASRPEALVDVCTIAKAQAKKAAQTRDGARRFFESHFRPQRVIGSSPPGLLTGYYEPLVKGSRTQDAKFRVPVYRRPPDLVNVVAESERARPVPFTHLRQTDRGLKPYLTRAEIDAGGLSGRGLELMYLKDPVDLFFMQVQGSGRIELPDGSRVRVTYDGKNGYPYTSIGRVLIDAGEVSATAMSLQALKQWLRADPERGRLLMWKNESYVFFRELQGAEARGPIGADGIPLQPGRSLAVDTSFHALGTPIFVDAPKISHATASGTFRRLMIAQDVGSAIKGPERGDIYFGSGDNAGRLAGITKEEGHFIVLLPVATGKSASIVP